MTHPTGVPQARLDYDDYPLLFRAADTNSLSGQRRYLWTVRLKLAAVVAAAGFGMLSWRHGGTEVAGVMAAACFAAALVAEVYELKERPDRLWYSGRAVAESSKTLTWRFVVGGAPLGVVGNDAEAASDVLLTRFREIATDIEPLWLVPGRGALDQLTPGMLRIRQMPLARRKELYLTQRINDQRAWYATKARSNARLATRWVIVLAVLELLGFSAGIIRAVGVVSVDLLGFVAAVVAAGAAWLQTKQHQHLATAYAVASHELSTIAARAGSAGTEESWAAFVADAEEAISREHTLWRASHGG
ncbi:DUF4231 domain-containing protein [Streptomyces flavidovirens]|uniref:DUF4231 domain-containing protein n=1 Tax=Streptomyces flavidovirens TaxID=67298 RepID=UPI00344356DD